MTTLATVDKCATTSCAFNHDGCAAPAMTMGGKGCVTFIAMPTRGGLDRIESHVGACQRADCAHNDHLICQASAVTIGADGAQCLTYQAA